MKLIYACLIALFAIGCTEEVDKTQYVYDYADILSEQDSAEIDSTLRQLNKNNIKLGVYITNNVPANFKGVEDAARKTGRKLGWGVEQGNIGAIIYVALKERKLYVAFDEGLFYTDEEARVVADAMLTRFKTQDFKGGILAAIKEVENLVLN